MACVKKAEYERLKYQNTEIKYCVYVLKIDRVDRQIIKVGKSNKLDYRLRNHKQSMYEKFSLLRVYDCADNKDAIKTERHIHNALKTFCIKTEWYEIYSEEELLDRFEKIDLEIQRLKYFDTINNDVPKIEI